MYLAVSLVAAPFAAKQSKPSTEEAAFLWLTALGLAALAQDRRSRSR